MEINPPDCGAKALTGSSVNIHFHGTNTAPKCHQDEVIHTLVNSGQSFLYAESPIGPIDNPQFAYSTTLRTHEQ
jgi:hypothetical protein